MALRSLYLILAKSVRRPTVACQRALAPLAMVTWRVVAWRGDVTWQVQQLIYLRHSVAIILGFVGLKMVLEFFHVHVSSGASLGVILALLAGGTIASMYHNRQQSAPSLGALAANGTPSGAKSVDVV